MAELYTIDTLHIPGAPEPVLGGDRGVFGGGHDGTTTVNTIDYISIPTPGNAIDFGDLIGALSGRRRSFAGCSNRTNNRGCFGGGNDGAPSNVIQYITVNSAGNATDFGDLTVARQYLGAFSNGTAERGCWTSGQDSGGLSNVIDYITINSTGNATDFGDSTQARSGVAGNSNDIRGLTSGGYTASWVDVIGYVTINSAGNAIDFGNLTSAKHYVAATSNGVNDRGIFGGGAGSSGRVDNIDYVTITSTGNATDFGDLLSTTDRMVGCSNSTDERGVFAGGTTTGATGINVIQYVTINSAGNATDFGNLTVGRYELAGLSNA